MPAEIVWLAFSCVLGVVAAACFYFDMHDIQKGYQRVVVNSTHHVHRGMAPCRLWSRTVAPRWFNKSLSTYASCDVPIDAYKMDTYTDIITLAHGARYKIKYDVWIVIQDAIKAVQTNLFAKVDTDLDAHLPLALVKAKDGDELRNTKFTRPIEDLATYTIEVVEVYKLDEDKRQDVEDKRQDEDATTHRCVKNAKLRALVIEEMRKNSTLSSHDFMRLVELMYYQEIADSLQAGASLTLPSSRRVVDESAVVV